jgi:hypothetical protein
VSVQLTDILPILSNNFAPLFMGNSLSGEFYVSLTVHLGTILVINQVDALFSMYLLFNLSTCFEHSVFIIRRVNLH